MICRLKPNTYLVDSPAAVLETLYPQGLPVPRYVHLLDVNIHCNHGQDLRYKENKTTRQKPGDSSSQLSFPSPKAFLITWALTATGAVARPAPGRNRCVNFLSIIGKHCQQAGIQVAVPDLTADGMSKMVIIIAGTALESRAALLKTATQRFRNDATDFLTAQSHTGKCQGYLTANRVSSRFLTNPAGVLADVYRFAYGARLDTLPTPSNLRRWHQRFPVGKVR